MRVFNNKRTMVTVTLLMALIASTFITLAGLIWLNPVTLGGF